MKRRLTAIALTPLMALSICVAVVFAAPTAGAYACTSRDSFTGSVYRMEHWLNCRHIRYDVYYMPNPRALVATNTPTAPSRTLMAGGPSCQWSHKNIVKICSQAFGKKYLICSQYWMGLYYPYHCGPVEAYNLTHAQGLWYQVKRLFASHGAQACYRFVAIGTPTAVILKVAGESTGIGLVATIGGGCIGGLIAFWWKG